MRKFVEELSISVNEKDAEIINLKMHLGDEKQKHQTRIKSNDSLLVQFKILKNLHYK